MIEIKSARGEIVDQQQDARNKFSSHVQSIAFQLTLSRRMIDCLRVVRDYGFPHIGQSADPKMLEAENVSRTVVKRYHQRGRSTFVSDNFVGFMQSLDKRGLVVWNQTPWNKRKVGERSLRLSRAGELTCALLVEAGLMPPVDRKKRRGR